MKIEPISAERSRSTRWNYKPSNPTLSKPANSASAYWSETESTNSSSIHPARSHLERTGKHFGVRGTTSWLFEEGKALGDWTTGHIALEIFGVEIAASVLAPR
jgi:hypothetical protein